MAVRLAIQNGKQIVVPVRIKRAVSGAPTLNAPDPDDRGFRMPRPGGWAVTTARGPMFGMMLNTTVRLKVIWDDVEGSAPLYVKAGTSGNPQISIASPAGGGLLGPDGEFRVQAVADNSTGQTIEVRLGSLTGPVVAEIEPHVFSPLTLNVTPHICTIHQAANAPGGGVAPRMNGAAIDLTKLFDLIHAVWQPAGVRFNVGAAVSNEYFGFTRDDFAAWDARAGPGSEARLVAANQTPNTCNVFLIRYMHNSLGVGVNRDTIASEHWTAPGIIIGVEGEMNDAGTASLRSSTGNDLYQEVANDLAHELGHFLSLKHVARVDNPGRSDTYSRRQLMHPVNLLPGQGGNVRFDDIGYGVGGNGSGHRGCLLSLKQHANISTDSDVARARAHFQSLNLY